MTHNTAQTILNQLGGNKFIAMTGAKNFVGGEDYLMFQLPTNQSKGNKMRITLNSSDTYNIELFKIRNSGISCKTIAFWGLVDAECLRNAFTSITGMETLL